MLKDFKWNPFTDIAVLIFLFVFVGVTSMSGFRHDVHMYKDKAEFYLGLDEPAIEDILDIMVTTKESTYNSWEYNRYKGELDDDVQEVLSKVALDLNELEGELGDEYREILGEYDKIVEGYTKNKSDLDSMGVLERHINEERVYIRVFSIYGILKMLVWLYRKYESRGE